MSIVIKMFVSHLRAYQKNTVRSLIVSALLVVYVTEPAMPCVNAPPTPPDVVITREPGSTDVTITVEGYTTFGSGTGMFCACAFDKVGVLTSVISVTLVDTSKQAFPGFSFSLIPATSAAFNAVEAGDWTGFLSGLSQVIPEGAAVNIIIEATIDATTTTEALVEALGTGGQLNFGSGHSIIGTDEGNSDGTLTGNHQSLLAAGTITVDSTVVGVDENDLELPAEFVLKQNYPNPFNPTSSIGYVLPKSSEVFLTVYNLRGEEVARLVEGYKDAGWHKVTWNASGVSSGIYFYRLQAGELIETKKMILLK